jgi:hypothetical protein
MASSLFDKFMSPYAELLGIEVIFLLPILISIVMIFYTYLEGDISSGEFKLGISLLWALSLVLWVLGATAVIG